MLQHAVLILALQVQSDAELEPGATERTVTLSGNPQATAEAERAIKEVISGVRFTACLVLKFLHLATPYLSRPCF